VSTAPAADAYLGQEAPVVLAERPRGRHRRPRPRKVLFAVGGMALAASALSLLRLASDPVSGGGTAGTAPRAADDLSDEETGSGASLGGVPSAEPTADVPMGDTGAAPTAPPAPGSATAVPAPSATSSVPSIGIELPDGPGGPGAPYTPPTRATLPETPATSAAPETPRPTQDTPTQQPPAARQPAAPDAPDSATTPDGTTEPAQPRQPGLCVPIVGVCVDDTPVGR
jgi:hypothetical protein